MATPRRDLPSGRPRTLSPFQAPGTRNRFTGPISLLALLPLLSGAQCGWNAAGRTGCQLVEHPRPLPTILAESSGVAFSAVRPDLLWSHNDGGHTAALYALDSGGHLLGTFTPLGAANRDWEDIATGVCGAGGCIYLADTGDNAEVRPLVDLYRVPDPGTVGLGGGLPAERFPMRLPDGPRDIEALFVLPGDVVHFVSKGRNHPVTVYRYPPPLRPGQEVTLETVQFLTEDAVSLPFQVTGADASRDGRIVVIRTYESLAFYQVTGGQLAPVAGGRVDLRTLQEPQGEGVGMGPGGSVALTTEAGSFGGTAALRILRCSALGGR